MVRRNSPFGLAQSYLYRHNSVKSCLFKLIVDNIAGNHCDVFQTFLFSFGVNV
jgi:hypothetical protein